MNKTGSISVACYEDIAAEYYDPRLHPTCRDLRELSDQFFRSHLLAGLPDDGDLVEIGPGSSTLAPVAAAMGALSRVILVDSSRRMLSYSDQWIAAGARSVVASAGATGLRSGSVSLIVSSLGDPYNVPEFWREVARLLKPNGRCLFTTPSFKWSSHFRSGSDQEVAEFLRSDGARLFMPSYVNDEKQQVLMIEAAGLFVEGWEAFGTELLSTEPAPKLLCVRTGTPVVAAYVVKAGGRS